MFEKREFYPADFAGSRDAQKPVKYKNKGLVIGKFMPLHKGHEFLINRAVREMDEVVVLLYNAPDFPIPLSRRAFWIKSLWPNMRVIQGRRAPQQKGRGMNIRKLHERYLVRVCGHLGITHVYSSEPYGEWAARILSAEHVMVDKERVRIPVSATMIRRNPKKFRKLLPEIVARDIVR